MRKKERKATQRRKKSSFKKRKPLKIKGTNSFIV